MYCETKSRGRTIIGMKLCLCAFLLIAVTASTVAAGETAGKPIQSFKFEENFSIRSALAMLGSAYGKNIVPTPQVDGQLAFRGLSNVTFEDAMDAILGSNFKYEQVGNLIRVYTKEEYKRIMEDPGRMEYKVFTLYYITAAEAQKLITPLLSTAAVVQVTSPAEKGISGGGGGGVGSASGASGASGAGGGASLGSGGSGDTLAMHDTIVLYDYPENLEAVRGMLDVIDTRPKQVLVEATILSALLTEDMELGVDWNLAAGASLGGFGDIKIGQGLTTGTPIETDVTQNVSGGGLKMGITTGDVRVFITALESITDTTVLATPKIMTVNKQLGSLLIGNKLGYVSQTSQNQTSTTQAVEFLETGTRLEFRPYIGNDGYIRMDIFPKDSSGLINDQGLPQENTTQLQANILVKDGETIVIGGLFRNVVTTTRNQVPILGDLPWIGAAFRGTTDTNQREEVIVLLTTHIIEDPKEAADEETAEDVRRRAEGAKDEMQSVGRAKIAEGAYEKAAALYIEGDVEGARKRLKVALRLRPAYTEAIRLKEKIDAEHPPTAVNDESMVEYEGTAEEEGMVKDEGSTEGEGMVIESVEVKDDSSWSKK